MKIAVPTTHGKLDAHFGHCREFTLFDIKDNQIQGITYVDAPPHQPGMLPKWLADKGATDIIAGGMGNKAIQLFNQLGINAFVGAPTLAPEEVVTGFLNESLTFTANYCDHQGHSCN